MVVLSKATAAETPYRIRACSSPGDDDGGDDDDYDDLRMMVLNALIF